jgi:outer membrane biosynthesis protein TonB
VSARLDFLSWAALIAAIVVTATGEYQLGIHAGFHPVIAAGIPAALDIYALRAMRARRDVAAVVLAMIATNALSHLVTTGLLPINVPLIVAVSAIAPLVFWRVHKLAHESAAESAPAALPTVKEAAPQSAPAPAPAASPTPPAERPEPVAESAPKAPPVAAPERPEPKPQSAPRAKAKAPRQPSAKRSRSATRADAKAAIEALYETKQGRPQEGDMTTVLKTLQGYPHTSRQHANTLRREIERERPDLAALGSDNVLALTGS